MTPKKSGNLKTTLSKELISKALIKLMKKKPFNEINITELTIEADLSRRTFYRHFKTTDDALKYILATTTKHFTEYFLKQPKKDLETVVFIYFSFWNRHKDFLILLKNNNLLHMLLQCFTPEVSEQIYLAVDNKDKTNIDYAWYFTCGRHFEYDI